MIAHVLRLKLKKLALETCIDPERFGRELSMLIDNAVVEIERAS